MNDEVPAERSPISSPADGVCALIITFHPPEGLWERATAIASQTEKLVIVDNASSSEEVSALRSLVEAVGAELIENVENFGIGVALNQGVEAARRHGFRWVLTLDQDTLVTTTARRDLWLAWRSCPFREKVAMIGSAIVNMPHDRPEGPWEERPVLITSGSLLSIDSFDRIGPFRDDYFIDYVDVEWCLRARARGYRLIVASTPAITHQIGSPQTHRFVTRQVLSSHHSPSRRYYQTRNRILLWRDHWRTERTYLMDDARYMAKDVVKALIYERPRFETARNIAAGLRDGVLGRTGKRHGRHGPQTI